jgi:hypothetical protein
MLANQSRSRPWPGRRRFVEIRRDQRTAEHFHRFVEKCLEARVRLVRHQHALLSKQPRCTKWPGI